MYAALLVRLSVRIQSTLLLIRVLAGLEQRRKLLEKFLTGLSASLSTAQIQPISDFLNLEQLYSCSYGPTLEDSSVNPRTYSLFSFNESKHHALLRSSSNAGYATQNSRGPSQRPSIEQGISSLAQDMKYMAI